MGRATARSSPRRALTRLLGVLALALLLSAAAVIHLGGIGAAPARRSVRTAARAGGHGTGASSAGYSAGERLGVYRGSAEPAAIRRFERWLGRPVSQVMEFLPYADWSAISEPRYFLRRWSRSRYRTRMVYSVPLLPRSGGSLAAGAAGSYDGYFRRLAALLVHYRQGHAILRLGWEFNGDWYPWSAAQDPAAFATYWRQIVETMRSVPGAGALRFDWCTSLGRNSVAPDLAYPGDAYVDFIGVDAYDQGWLAGWSEPKARWQSLVEGPYGLRWQTEFAAVHHRAPSIPEWGLALRSDGHGGGDDPYYLTQLSRWVTQHRYAYYAYFEEDGSGRRHSLMSGQFPRGAARFRQIYG